MFAMFLLSLLLLTTVAGCDEVVKKATLAVQQNNPAQALVLLEPLRSTCTQSSNFYEVLGLADELSGNKDSAEKALISAVSLDAKSSRLLTELGATLLRNGKPAQASKTLDRALLLDSSNIVTLKYAVGAAVGSHNWARAAELFKQMNIENNSRILQEEPILTLWLAQTLMETGQNDRLNTFLSDLPSPMPPALLFSLGTLFAQHGMYQKAIDYLKQVPPEAADDALFFNLGLSYSHLQQFDEARRCYFEAIDKHPDHIEAYLHVGLDYVASGQPRMGIPWLYRAQSLAPARPEIACALAEALIALDYFNSAKEVLARAAETTPQDALVLVANGDLKRAQGDSAGAMALYHRALAGKPGLAAAVVGLARADVSTGKDPEAKNLLRSALVRDAQEPTVNGELGLLEAHEGDWSSAEQHLSRAWAQDHSNPEIALALARAYQRIDRPLDALRLLQSIGPKMEDSPAFHFQLAQLYAALHRFTEAQTEREMHTTLQARSQDALHFENPRTYVH